jgi:hypothetical protein
MISKAVVNLQTQILCSIFFSENLTFYEVMWKYTLQPDRPQMTILLMCIACSITKATNKYSEYVIIFAFPLRQCLQESAPLLRYAYSTLPVL